MSVDTNEYPSRIANALERIADALEKLAEDPKDNDKGPRVQGFGRPQ